MKTSPPRDTVICGDARQVMAQWAARSIEAIVCDPPYGVEHGDLAQAAAEMLRITVPGGLAAVFSDTRALPIDIARLEAEGWEYLRALTLYCPLGHPAEVFGWRNTSDLILVLTKPGAPYAFHGKARDDVYVRSDIDIPAEGHPARKPVRILEDIISRICPPGGTVVDPFAGSGSTGLAARNTGRRFVLIEMCADWVAVAEKRLAESGP